MDASDASQRGNASDASQLGNAQVACVVRIGSFNCGVVQAMLNSTRTQTYLDRLQNVISVCVQEGQLDIMNLCEVGGHKSGLKKAGINAEGLALFQHAVGPQVAVDNNYLTTWGFDADAPQRGVRLTPTAPQHDTQPGLGNM